MKTLRIAIGLVVLALAPLARADVNHIAQLRPGDEHTYQLHVESERSVNLGMGMEREENVTLDAEFDLLVQEVTDEGARVRLIWREVNATPAGVIAGASVNDAMREAWADASRVLIDEHLEMFVLTDGRLVSIEGLSALAPDGAAGPVFDRVFAEHTMIAMVQGVFMPTGEQRGAPGVGILACDIQAITQTGREAETLTGTATLDVPSDLAALPGLEKGTGKATGTLVLNAADGWLISRTLTAQATIDANSGPFKGTIEARSVIELERMN